MFNRTIGLFVIVALLPLALFAWDWRKDWMMPGDVYRSFDFRVRASVDKATGVFNKAIWGESARNLSEQDRIASFRTAAAEWRKVQVQSETGEFDEQLLSYALYMQGCACEKAKDSNEAIRLYSEVIELYPDILWVSVQARFRLGCVHAAMGDIRKSNEIFEELLDEPAFRGTKARVITLRICGDRKWNDGKYSEAIMLWREILNPSSKADNNYMFSVRDKLIAVSMAMGDYSFFDDLIFFGVGNQDSARLEAVRKMLQNICWVWIQGGHWHDFSARCVKLYPNADQRSKKLAASKASFLSWFEQQHSLYEATKDPTLYPLDLLRVAIISVKKDVVAPRLEVLERLIREEKDPKKSTQLANSTKDLLLSAKLHELARRIPNLIKDPLTASYMRYQIEYADGKSAAAALCLEEYLGHKPNEGAAKAAKLSLARLYRDNLGKYDKAIALFQEVNNPPQTLWELHTTYRRCGKKKEAYNILVELESMFPTEAPQAFYIHARNLEEDGDKTKAISIYKRLLSQPEWKKTQQSSWAHQALERYGIATGGAVIHEVR